MADKGYKKNKLYSYQEAFGLILTDENKIDFITYFDRPEIKFKALLHGLIRAENELRQHFGFGENPMTKPINTDLNFRTSYTGWRSKQLVEMGKSIHNQPKKEEKKGFFGKVKGALFG